MHILNMFFAILRAFDPYRVGVILEFQALRFPHCCPPCVALVACKLDRQKVKYPLQTYFRY